MRVLLTGATGILGGYLLRRWQNDPSLSALCLHRPGSQPDFAPSPQRTFQPIDFLDSTGLRTCLETFEPQCIIHAASSGMKAHERRAWAEMNRFNVDSSLTLLEGAAQVGAQMIFLSSGLAYTPIERPLVESDPLSTENVYGASKHAVETLLCSGARSLNVPLTILRPFSFTGIGDHSERLFPTILKAAYHKEVAQLTVAEQRRDFCAAEDVAEAVCLAMECAARPSVTTYNVGSGSQQTLYEMLMSVAEALGIELQLHFKGPGDRPIAPWLVASTEKIQTELGWKPKVPLAYAVWELAQSLYPDWALSQPEKQP